MGVMQRLKMHGAKFALISVVSFAPSPSFAISVGEQMPDISLPASSSLSLPIELRNSALRGKVVYIDFWASWCLPCRQSLPWMESLKTKFPELEVVPISIDREREFALRLLKARAPSLAAYHDPNAVVIERFNPPVMPTSYLVDRTGTVTSIHRGLSEADQKAIEDEIARLLGVSL